MRSEPVPIGRIQDRQHYHSRREPPTVSEVDLVDVLRAQSDELIELGDPRLAVERAFRWGYQNANGDSVPGLQHHLQELSARLEKLARQVEHHSFLDALNAELDRIDDLDNDQSARQQAGTSNDNQRTALDRIAERLETGFDTDEARGQFEELLDALTDADGEPGSWTRSNTTPGSESVSGQPSGGRRESSGSRRREYQRIASMMFPGGAEGDAGGQRGWTRPEHEALHRRLLPELMVLEELAQLERAVGNLRGLGSATMLPDHDLGAVSRDLPDDIAAWLRAWRDEVGRSRSIGGTTSSSSRFELPPDVARVIGADILKGLFKTVASPLVGDHQSMRSGNAGDTIGESRPWEPGRPLDLDLVSTVFNAVKRDPSSVAGSGVKLVADDFDVVERSASISLSTVLAVDRSRSMGQNGGWSSAKRVGLALHELIRRSYPRDSLDLIAFSSTAETVRIDDLPVLPWDQYEHGTNLQEALALSRTALRRRRGGTRQIVLITDGEPTLVTVGGQEVFSSPPDAVVLDATMREALRCTREGITINVVMLTDSTDMHGFVETLTRYNKGRIFQVLPDTLGSFLLRDYVAR